MEGRCADRHLRPPQRQARNVNPYTSTDRERICIPFHEIGQESDGGKWGRCRGSGKPGWTRGTLRALVAPAKTARMCGEPVRAPRSRPVSYRHTWPLFMRPLSCNAWLGWVETALVHFTSLVSSHRRWSSSSSRGHKKNQKHKGKRLWFRGRWRILGTRKGSGWRRRGWCTAR